MDSRKPRLPGELVFIALLVLFSVFMLWQAYSISGFESITSAGSYPMVATGVMVVCGLLIAADTTRAPPVERAPGESLPQQFVRLLTPRVLIAFTLAIALYMLALEPIGFPISSYVFLVVSMALLGSRRWLLNLIVSAVALGVIYAIFQTVFSVVLPTGTLLSGAFK